MNRSNAGRSRRVIRAASLGLLTLDATATADRERALVGLVRARRQEPAVVAVLAGKGGVGTTTTAIGVGLTLAALRPDGTRLIDVRAGTPSLGRLLAGRPAPNPAQLAVPPRSTAANPVAAEGDRSDGPPSVWGLQIVDGAPWYAPTAQSELDALLADPVTPTATTLLDLGNDVGELARSALAGAGRIVLVTGAGEAAAEPCRIALGRAFQVSPGLADTAIMAVIRASSRRDRGATKAQLGVPAGRTVAVPFDPALRGGPAHLDRLRPATREAYLELAALINS